MNEIAEVELEPVRQRGAGELLAPGYVVVDLLHHGGDLDVYDVWSEERDCRCVAKVVRPDRLGDRAARGRLIREGQILIRLTHPHIVRAYELVPRPIPMLVIETLPGETVSHMIAGRRRRLPLTDIICLGLHLCSAIHYLHRQGFLHLDLKPSNIVADRGVAKVLDLSIARRPGRGPKGMGTRQYMAPEQARGDLLSAATDVWGIGAVLFEASTGQQPFTAYPEGRRYDQLERKAASVSTYRRVPSAFTRALEGCLAPEPARRPTIDQLSSALKSLLGDMIS
jgi:serine/threonine protein kinase